MKKSEWVATVEKAIAEIRERYPNATGGIHIAWGYADKEEEQLAKDMEAISLGEDSWQETEALLSWLDKKDYAISIHANGDKDFPDPCYIETALQSQQVLPRTDARRLFNVLKRCQPGVSLSIVPDDDPDDTNPDIFIAGVIFTIGVEAITGRTLHDALFRLALTADALEAYFAGEGDYDHWSIWTGGD